jgi:aminopeptidase N
MNHTYKLFLSALFCLSALYPLQAQQLHEEYHNIHCKAIHRATHALEAMATSNYAAGHTDLHYLEIHWTIDPAEVYIRGEITYHFTSKIDQLTQFVLDLAQTMQINSIRRGNIDLAYTHADQLLTIELGKTLNIGEGDTLTINYEGAPVSTGIGSFVQTFHDGHPTIETESIPYGVRDWWPAKQDLIDKVDSLDTYITTPGDQLAASNGKLVSITEVFGNRLHHWRHRHPIVSYLIAMAVTNYTAYSHYVELPDGDSIEILNYVYPEDAAAIQQETPATVEIMEFFNEKFGLYPFADEKYGHAQFSEAATEIQTMSFMGFWNFSVIAHELAHQWFGDFVTCGSYSEIWLNEGWAEYLAGLSIEALRPSLWSGEKTAKINLITSQPDGSVYVPDTTDVNRIFDGRLTYYKGFYLAHMLRWLVGDSMFFQASRNYLYDPEQANGFARTADLQHHFEAVSGKDLDEFFADWYTGEGFPSYTINWMQEQDSVILWVEQTQSHTSVSFYEMPIPIIAYRFGIIADTVLQHDYNNQRFAIYVGNNQISQIIFDQDKWILSKNNKVIKLTTATGDVAQSKYRVFPNPAADFIEIENGEDIYAVDFTNATGLVIKRNLVDNKINVSDLTRGQYIMHLRNRDGKIMYYTNIVLQ